jgi:hypothetical protein
LFVALFSAVESKADSSGLRPFGMTRVCLFNLI